MTVKKLQNAYYVTTNMDRAVAFYGDVLGLPTKFRDGTNWTQFDAGGVNFSVSSPQEAAAGATGAVVIFEVDDIDAMRQRLSDAGADILDSRDMGDHGRSLTFRDPDGNLAQLFQRSTS
jgi:predicted enzyme related to lactoylglutathione lyase